MNKCRHPDCHNPAPHGQLYCSTKCYHTDPVTLARLERQRLDALARLEQLRAEGRDPAHGGQAAEKRGEAIAWSNYFKPRRRKKQGPTST